MTTYHLCFRMPPMLVDAFTRRTYELSDAFHQELGVEPDPRVESAILLASDFLIEDRGPQADWEAFDLADYFRRAAAQRMLPQPEQAKATLTAFVAFLARSGVVSADVAARAEHVSPSACAFTYRPNRAARRYDAAMSRRRARASRLPRVTRPRG